MNPNKSDSAGIVKSIVAGEARYGVNGMRIRAGMRIGRLNEFTLRTNAKSASDRWIREVCWRELERRKELEK